MKQVSVALRLLAGCLITLAALVFAVPEITLLITLDFNLYEHPWIALAQLAAKLLIVLAAGALGIGSLVKGRVSLLWEGVCLLLATAVMIPFMSNGIGWYLTAASALFVLAQLLSAKAGGK